MESSFPKKPVRSSVIQAKPLKLFANYYSLQFNSPEIKGISKY
jgi:hypothetical protein